MKWEREILLNEKAIAKEVIRLRQRFIACAQADESQAWRDLALEIFRFQAQVNPVYRRYVELMEVNAMQVSRIEDIPFLPVELFQTQRVSVFPSPNSDVHCFESSGTTGSLVSKHPIDDLGWYDQVTASGFERLMSPWSQKVCFFGLLPGYLERKTSSLVHMVQSFMLRAGQSDREEWFFLNDFDALEERLQGIHDAGYSADEPIYIVGVTHALLKWSGQVQVRAIRPAWLDLPLHIIETGGMKGHGKERIRAELHEQLETLTSGRPVGSEYGMTELLSQAWSKGDGIFHAPPWMRVLIGALNDPRGWADAGRQGRIHVMDLANVSTCSFLATSDIGRNFADGSFEVLGRFDHAEVRGCNLMTMD